MAENPKVFISYSWDSDAHRGWVRELAERLVSNGVDVRLDQWNLVPGDSLTAFMEEQIEQCDFVLIVCTPNYAERSTARRGGVGYEQQIISGQVATGLQRRKFIPVIREGELQPGPGSAVPPHFAGIYAIDMRSRSGSEEQFEGLLRTIYKVPAISSPPLGPKPTFTLAEGKQSAPAKPARLASIEFDGWELLSGVAMNEHHPETYGIPSAEERSSVIPSDFVKLSFEITTEDPDAGGLTTAGERMWVRVEGRYGPYIWGKLSNDPISGHEYGLEHGAEIVFLPEHIIDIVDAEQQSNDEAAYRGIQGDLAEHKETGEQHSELDNLRPVLRKYSGTPEDS